jgi:hypothetical protein
MDTQKLNKPRRYQMMDFGPLRQVDAFFNGDFKGPLAD